MCKRWDKHIYFIILPFSTKWSFWIVQKCSVIFVSNAKNECDRDEYFYLFWNGLSTDVNFNFYIFISFHFPFSEWTWRSLYCFYCLVSSSSISLRRSVYICGHCCSCPRSTVLILTSKTISQQQFWIMIRPFKKRQQFIKLAVLEIESVFIVITIQRPNWKIIIAWDNNKTCKITSFLFRIPSQML